MGWEYDVYSECSPVIHISKELFQWGDTYVLDFADPADELMGMLLVIAIDALATRNIARINRVVQINNTGIQPGSGVGNHRMSLSEKSLHIPVIAIGVATVTSIGAILQETMEVSGEEKQAILQKIHDSDYLNLVVTPKSMDDELKHLVYIVSESLNRFLHPDYQQL